MRFPCQARVGDKHTCILATVGSKHLESESNRSTTNLCNLSLQVEPYNTCLYELHTASAVSLAEKISYYQKLPAKKTHCYTNSGGHDRPSVFVCQKYIILFQCEGLTLHVLRQLLST